MKIIDDNHIMHQILRVLLKTGNMEIDYLINLDANITKSINELQQNNIPITFNCLLEQLIQDELKDIINDDILSNIIITVNGICIDINVIGDITLDEEQIEMLQDIDSRYGTDFVDILTEDFIISSNKNSENEHIYE